MHSIRCRQPGGGDQEGCQHTLDGCDLLQILTATHAWRRYPEGGTASTGGGGGNRTPVPQDLNVSISERSRQIEFRNTGTLPASNPAPYPRLSFPAGREPPAGASHIALPGSDEVGALRSDRSVIYAASA